MTAGSRLSWNEVELVKNAITKLNRRNLSLTDKELTSFSRRSLDLFEKAYAVGRDVLIIAEIADVPIDCDSPSRAEESSAKKHAAFVDLGLNVGLLGNIQAFDHSSDADYKTLLEESLQIDRILISNLKKRSIDFDQVQYNAEDDAIKKQFNVDFEKPGIFGDDTQKYFSSVLTIFPTGHKTSEIDFRENVCSLLLQSAALSIRYCCGFSQFVLRGRSPDFGGIEKKVSAVTKSFTDHELAAYFLLNMRVLLSHRVSVNGEEMTLVEASEKLEQLQLIL